MPTATLPTLTPRKVPVQARSATTVQAILEATIQVLIAAGKERLTTTQVAARAGVSVGTLYQYFPNKSALLQACLRLHMETIIQACEEACCQHHSRGLLEMADALIDAYIQAKLADLHASATLYSVSSDIDGAAIAKAASVRVHRAGAALFATAKEGLTKDPEIVATVVFAALYGIIRRLLEMKNPQRHLEPLRTELTVLVHGYLQTCIANP